MSPTRRPRVLLLIKGLGLGGAERLLARSLPHIDRDEFDYEVAYFLPWKDDLVPEFEDAGIPVHCLEIRRDLDIRAAFKIVGLLRQREIDLVHTHSPYPAALARVAARLTGVRAMVHTEHNVRDSFRRTTQIANMMTHPLNHLTIAVSQGVADSIGGRWPFKPRDLRVVHGGYDETTIEGVSDEEVHTARLALDIPDDHLIVGNVAHLRAQKAYEVFLEAAAGIAKARPNTSFVIVGREKNPGYQARLEALADEMGLGQQVRFTGFLPNPYPYVALFDVFMMSSRYEGFPIALIEAMAMSKPVVATRVGGVSEAIVHDQNGLMVEPDDPRALAEMTLRLLDDESERARLAQAARHTAHERFSIGAMVAQIELAYRDVLR